MKWIGIDPGLNTTGYAVLELPEMSTRSSGALGSSPQLIEAGIIQPDKKIPTADLGNRLHGLYTGIIELLDQYKPENLGIEQLYSHYQHPRTAILMGHARGVIILAATEMGVPVCSYSATQVKKMITGSGRASKIQMQFAILRELKLAKIPEPNDVADAMAIALCHFAHQKNQSNTLIHG